MESKSGLGVTCSPRNPRFAGSNPTEVDGFFPGRKNPYKKYHVFAPMGRFQLESILPLFSTVVPAIILMLLSCRPFVAITTLSTGLVGVEVTSVSWLGQLTVGV